MKLIAESCFKLNIYAGNEKQRRFKYVLPVQDKKVIKINKINRISEYKISNYFVDNAFKSEAQQQNYYDKSKI